MYLGDARWDGTIDSADVISVYRALISPEGVTGICRLLADANDDLVVDENDVIYVSDIILGTAKAHMLTRLAISQPVSFVLPPDTTGITASEAVQVGAVSFYYPAPVSTQPTEINAVQIGSPSFLYLAPFTGQAGEENVVEIGSPSFIYSPSIEEIVNETNAIEWGTPSFDRQ